MQEYQSALRVRSQIVQSYALNGLRVAMMNLPCFSPHKGIRSLNLQARKDFMSDEQSAPQYPRWRLYTADGVTTSSAQMRWEQAPAANLVAVVWQHPDMGKPEVELGAPYYYHGGTWIRRVWDHTLYLRQCGRVKFGRWTDAGLFNAAWCAAVHSILPKEQQMTNEEILSNNGGVVCSTQDALVVTSVPQWWVYYDDRSLYTADQYTWAEIPADGVLAVCYRHVHDNLSMTIAKRRYTYFYWHGNELINTDDQDLILSHFPEIKRGRISFDGLVAVRPMADALQVAMADTLEDLPWPI
jgi:hypothetical protein